MPRINSQESISIQVLLPAVDCLDTPRVVNGTTADVSATGLRVLLGEPVEPERVFDLCIQLDFNPQYFLLAGETRWCRFNDQMGYYEVGILIHDSEGTDYEQWGRLFS